MKQYDFETVHPRYNLNSAKWNEISKYFPDNPQDIIPFSVADMELPLAPQIREGLKECIDTYVLGYTDPSPEYYQVVCDFLRRHHDWEVKPEWISCTGGAIAAFFTCVKAYTKPDEGVILFTPVYYPMYTAVTSNNRELVSCPLLYKSGRYEIDFILLEQLVKNPNNKLLILCSPHNPGGRIWSESELNRIGGLCKENDVVIVSDELHFDFVSPGAHHTVLASLSQQIADNCITITSPSKSFNLAGLMTTNVIISSEELRERFRKEMLTTTHKLKCNMLGHLACVLAYTQCDDWLEQVNALIYKNCQLVVDFFKEEYPQIRPMEMEGSYLLWIDFSAIDMDSRELAEILKQEGRLFFDDGYIFGNEGDGFERWNLACPTVFVEEGIARLRQVLKKYLE